MPSRHPVYNVSTLRGSVSSPTFTPYALLFMISLVTWTVSLQGGDSCLWESCATPPYLVPRTVPSWQVLGLHGAAASLLRPFLTVGQ